ncbi:MAG: hydrogenase nickel incorporation protein HypA/HybF [Frankiaceae bacterium]|jgi:hydrogenase nickel incorporation protein HypA/HybF|nr:hydrogenase nickel incorporation protein HypA/HybF [Frankiaceae bacterium]
MSYSEGVLTAVERRAHGRPVARVGVRIGAVHRVVADAFDQSFRMAAAGTVAEGAATELVVVPVHGHCMDCRNEFDAVDPAPACPACGSLDVAVSGGDDVILEWIQYAETAGPDLAAEPVPPHTHDHPRLSSGTV